MASFLKKYLSYVTPQLIETRKSEYSEVLKLYLSNGRYMLCADNAIYSYEDKYINFVKAFNAIDFEGHSFKKVLILGFGLGSIPIILEKQFGDRFEITGVELDEQVASLFSKFAQPKISSNSNFTG